MVTVDYFRKCYKRKADRTQEYTRALRACVRTYLLALGRGRRFIGQRKGARWQKVDQSAGKFGGWRSEVGKHDRVCGVRWLGQLFACFRYVFVSELWSNPGRWQLLGWRRETCSVCTRGQFLFLTTIERIFFSWSWLGFRLARVRSSYPQMGSIGSHCCQFNNVTSENCVVKYILGAHKFLSEWLWVDRCGSESMGRIGVCRCRGGRIDTRSCEATRAYFWNWWTYLFRKKATLNCSNWNKAEQFHLYVK